MGRGGKKKVFVKKVSKKRNSSTVFSSPSHKKSSLSVDSRGAIEWRNKEGLLHRVDGPARTFPDGTQEWYRDGKNWRKGGLANLVRGDKTQEWLKEGLLHREGGPARVRDGSEEWYRDGLLHREDGPAYTAKIKAGSFPFKTKEAWYRNGLLHREGGPARTLANGTCEWHRDGNLWREDGLPNRVQKNGTEQWLKDGVLHREGAPALKRKNGAEEYYFKGRLHREDGPAISTPDGYEEWRIHGDLHRIGGPAIITKNKIKQFYENGLEVRDGRPAFIDSDGARAYFDGSFVMNIPENGEEELDVYRYIYHDGSQEWWTRDVKMIYRLSLESETSSLLDLSYSEILRSVSHLSDNLDNAKYGATQHFVLNYFKQLSKDSSLETKTRLEKIAKDLKKIKQDERP